MRYRFKTKPMKHQRGALKFLAKNKGVGALLMDPGTGKTKVVIDYLGARSAKWGSCTALITAPLSALDTWVEQFRDHLGTWVDDEGNEREIPCELFILNDGSILEKAETIANMEQIEEGIRAVIINHDAFKYRHLVPGLKTVTVRDRIVRAVVDKFAPDVLVVDEMHRAKSHTSNLSKSLVKIADSTFERIGMTGTVAPHSPLDFFAQWLIINPNVFGRRWRTFQTYYAIFGGFEGRQVIGFYADRLKEMRKLREPDSYVVKKRDALDLPKVTDIKVPVTLMEEADAYLKMGRDLMVLLPSGKQSISQHTLTKVLRLRQITGGNLGYKELTTNKKGKPVEVSHSEEIGSSKLRALSEKVVNIADAGEKQVVFAHFREDCRRIVEHLEKELKSNGLKHVPVFLITGDTKGNTRVRRRKEFQAHEGPAVFVAQMRTVSLAVNEFVCASYGHFFSYSQLRDDYEQARDRLDRNGQTQPVTFYHYLVPNSVDEVIYQSHKEKQKLETMVTKRAKEILTLGAG